MGPHNLFEWVAAYLEEEQHLGRLGHLPSLTMATLLLGPCFQWVFNQQFLGFDPFHHTEQQFAEELVRGVLAGLLPERGVMSALATIPGLETADTDRKDNC